MWLKGMRGWYDEAEKRHRRVQLIDFERTAPMSSTSRWNGR